MNRIFIAIMLLCAAHLLPVAAKASQDFVLVNATGFVLTEVYVSPNKADTWEEDVLGMDVLNDGQQTEIKFSRSEETCLWDLRIVYDDGTPADFMALNLCTISQVVIQYHAKTGETSASYD